MPPLTDLNVVHTLLNRDRNWAVYAIGDLSPGLVEHAEWHAPADHGPALLLLYRGFDPPIAFAMGNQQELHPLFAEVTAPRISLQVQAEAIAAMTGIYTPTHTQRMLRMALQPAAFTPVACDGVQAIDGDHLDAVTALYDDGHRRGEGPTFFYASMLQQKTFRGVWENGALVAVAGTHLFSADLGVCAIGNVYTRSDCRGRGLGARVASAVVAHALQQNVTTIALNVGQDNAAAQRVYRRLGFEPYCAFWEGEATRAS